MSAMANEAEADLVLSDVPNNATSSGGGGALRRIFSFKHVAAILLVLYFAIFLVYPMYMAFAGSLHNWNPLIGQYEWVGIENFRRITSDGLFWSSIGNTFFFAGLSTIFRVVVGLALALMLHSKLVRGRSFLRAIFYMPTITPLIAVSFVWVWLYDPQFGLVNRLSGLDINWLRNPTWAMPAIILMTVWKDFGYATVIFLAGLMGLPEDVFEAASIDGAGKWRTFWSMTWPLLAPTTLFVVITSLISYLQSFIQIMVMTEGGPGTSTYTISYLIFEEAFTRFNFGSASAMAIILFVLTGILTILMFKVSGERGMGQV